MAEDDRETEKLSLRSAGLHAARGAAAPSTCLHLAWRDGSRVVPLAPGEALVVGRTLPSDVVVDDPSLSRQHARFVGTRGGAAVEDLGSTNGTLVRGEAAQEAELLHGDKVRLGALVVTILSASGDLPWGEIGPHDRFVAAVSDELGRARFFRRPCALAMVSFAAAASPDDVHRALREILRPIDRAGRYSGGVVELLLPELSASDVERRLRAAQAKAGGAALRAGVAATPDDGSTVEELIGAAFGRLRGAGDERPIRAGDGQKGVRPAQPTAGASGTVASARMRELEVTAERVAKSAVPILILGETGTGKELLARAIHDKSPRRDKPLLCVNCGAIPASLVESILFGHERGAFTGAAQRSAGVFESASGGTVFFDEIGELPLATQAVLLRVLESKSFMRVGSTKEIVVDTRIVAATHKDLERMVREGTFRQDLLYRLNAVTLELPPLRERAEDLPALVDELLAQAAAGLPRAPVLDADVREALAGYAWPGNIRELRNVLERAVAVAEGDAITLEDLPERLRGPRAAPAPERAPAAPALVDLGQILGDYRGAMETLETELLRFALEREGWNQTHAARRLEMPLRTLVHKIKVLRIRRPDDAKR